MPASFIAAAFSKPFKPSTTIHYSLLQNNDVSSTVYDMLGKETWNYRLSNQTGGTHELQWNGVNSNGQQIGSGVYILKVTAGKYIATEILLLLK